MALNETDKKVTRKTTSKQQREEEYNRRIEELTEEIASLEEEVSVVRTQRKAIDFPNLKEMTAHHVQYGEGTVTEQKGAVLTISYSGMSKKQKLPFVLVSGCISVEDESAVVVCRAIDELDQKISHIEKEIGYRRSEIADLKKRM